MRRLALTIGFVLLAPLAWGHGQIDVLIADATEALRTRPHDTKILWKRAELYRAHEEWDAAMADFAQIRALAPDDAWLDLAEAEVHFGRGDTEAARAQVARFLRAAPDSDRGYELLARIETASGDPAAAAEAYRGAQGRHASPPPSYYLYEADAHEAAGDPREALAALDRGVERLGELPTLVFRAIDIARRSGRHDEALARAALLPRAFSESPAGLALTGDLYRDLNRVFEAAAYHTDALERLYDTKHPDDWNDSDRALAARLELQLSDSLTFTRKGSE
ncbi:MAG: tetratricopeptide repeat protein [Gemmatimonadetes bacterium]|nr:tetratricopeptide repeat protein [Gemmatimonadota bacterium]